MMKNVIKKVFIIVGEASGDILGGDLVKFLHKRDGNVLFYGIGGPIMKKNKVTLFANINKLSIMGFVDAALKIFYILNIIKIIKNKIKELKPDLIILIDFPDFNLYIASIAKKFNISTVYYVPPQIWAWRKNRVYIIKKLVDYVIITFPFEEKIYVKEKIPVFLVKHPILNKIDLYNNKYFSKSRKNIIGILPGSRNSEVRCILPVMLKVALMMRDSIPKTSFIVSISDSVNIRLVYEIFKPYKDMFFFTLKGGAVQNILKKSSFLIAMSGTITLEAALLGIPTLILYKTSFFNYLIGSVFVKSKFIGLPNIILGRKVFLELIQDKAYCSHILKKVICILNDDCKLNEMRNDLILINKRLTFCASDRHISEIVLDIS